MLVTFPDGETLVRRIHGSDPPGVGNRATLADDPPTSRGTFQRQAGGGRARDRLGLAAFLGVDAGIGAGRVDQA